MIFIEVLMREIGLKSFTLVGPSVFGIRVMQEPFRLYKQTFPQKKA